jgi:flagellar hook-length control protein FliK
MPQLDTTNLLTAAATKTSRPANTAADTQSGSAFGAVLANQQIVAEAQLPDAVSGKTELDLVKTISPEKENLSLNNKETHALDETDKPADTTNNVLAMLQPLQELRIAPAVKTADTPISDKPHSLQRNTHDSSGNRITSKANMPSAVVVTQAELDKGNTLDESTVPIPLESQHLSTAHANNMPTAAMAASTSDTPSSQALAPFTAALLWQANPTTENSPMGSSQSISSPLGSAGWADDFSQKISWMLTSKQEQIAQLHLNPPDLGPLEIVLKISDSQATAIFTSPHSAVREAVENALPKLRDILADNGITLGNTTVSDQSNRDGDAAAFGGQQSHSQNARWPSPTANRVELPELPTLPSHSAQRHKGRVDTFA